MEVSFAFTRGTRSGSHKIGRFNIVPENGVYKTTKKDVIEAIYGSDLYRRGTIKSLTDLDAVEVYLSGKEPDVLTKEVIATLPKKAVLEIAFVANTVEREREFIIRSELVNIPVNNEIKKILDKYAGTTDKQMEDYVAKAVKDGLIEAGERGWYKSADGEFRSNKKADVEQYCYELYHK